MVARRRDRDSPHFEHPGCEMKDGHPGIDPNKLAAVLATDCGSTTTKAVLFEKTPAGWRQTFRGEAPTTVEKPVADVTIGATNAFREVQELSGRRILAEKPPAGDGPPFEMRRDADPKNGID